MSGYPNNSAYYERLLKYANVAGISRDIVNFKKMCRLCMFQSEDRDNLNSFIQVDMADTIGTTFDNKQSIAFILKNVIGLPISTFNDDDMPQQICRKCIVRIGELYAFQIQCHKIDYLYKQLHRLMKEFYLDYSESQNTFPEENLDDGIEVEYLEDNVQAYEVVETDHLNNEFIMIENKNTDEKKENEERPFTPEIPEIPECCFCKQTFETKKARKKHLKHVHPGQTYASCMLCPRIFSTRSSCSRHMLKFHGENTRKVCQICFKVKLNREEMKVHLETHKKNPNPKILENAKNLNENCENCFVMNKLTEANEKLDTIEEALISILDSNNTSNETSIENENFTELSDRELQCPNIECRQTYKTNVMFLSSSKEEGLLVECLNCHLQYPVKMSDFEFITNNYVAALTADVTVVEEKTTFQSSFIDLNVIDKANDNNLSGT